MAFLPSMLTLLLVKVLLRMDIRIQVVQSAVLTLPLSHRCCPTCVLCPLSAGLFTGLWLFQTLAPRESVWLYELSSET